jgi:hypothetical protein
LRWPEQSGDPASGSAIGGRFHRGTSGWEDGIMMTYKDAYVRAMMMIGNVSGRLQKVVEAETYKALLHSKQTPEESIKEVLDLFNKDMEEHFLNADVDIAMMLDHLLNTINPKNDGAKKRFAESLLSMDEESAKQDLVGTST